MYDIWYQQIEAIANHANRWLNFSLACAWIGFGLSLAAAVIYIIILRRENK